MFVTSVLLILNNVLATRNGLQNPIQKQLKTLFSPEKRDVKTPTSPQTLGSKSFGGDYSTTHRVK